jgi:Tfp pilus assembly protein PilX
MKNQRGQVLVVLLLVMLVGLTIGLAITQRTVTDVSTSTQVEQSSRAFSAAEAGIESGATRTFSQGTSTFTLDNSTLSNDSSANVTVKTGLPEPGQAIEYPGSRCSTKGASVNRESVAQFWLVNPRLSNFNYSTVSADTSRYTGPSITIYFGDTATCPNFPTPENPAIEANLLVMDSAGQFFTQRTYYDSINRNPANNFQVLSTVSECSGSQTVDTTVSIASLFRCAKVLNLTYSPPTGFSCAPNPCLPILVRVRILYNEYIQKVALAPYGAPAGTYPLPPQVDLLTSVGQSGQSQRTISAFRFYNIPLPFFDYAIFSRLRHK